MVWKKLKKAVARKVRSVQKKVRSSPTKSSSKKASKDEEEYSNRFLKFYHCNKKRLLKERKKLYHQKLKAGICVRCNNETVEGIKFCSYHQAKQKEYNKQARLKRKKKKGSMKNK